MSQKIRVGVIFGGQSGEHEVSLVSATSIINALDPAQYEVVPIGITREGRWVSSGDALKLLKERTDLNGEPERVLVPEPGRRALVSTDGLADQTAQLDVVFPVVHGVHGEDGTIQGLLELANIPYVGAGVLASAVGMDKIVQKELFANAGLSIPKYLWFLSKAVQDRQRRVVLRVERAIRYPVFTKPANTGSSVGISKCHDRGELVEGLKLALQYDRKVLIEQGIKNAREIECSVLGNDEPEASVPGEVIPSNEFYDYDAKYVDGKSRSIIPAQLPKNVVRRIREIAVEAFRLIDGAGMSRVDFFVTKRTNKIYLNEINTIPGFTSISMYPKLWEASGVSFPELLDRLIALAIQRQKEKSGLKHIYQPARDWYRG